MPNSVRSRKSCSSENVQDFIIQILLRKGQKSKSQNKKNRNKQKRRNALVQNWTNGTGGICFLTKFLASRYHRRLYEILHVWYHSSSIRYHTSTHYYQAHNNIPHQQPPVRVSYQLFFWTTKQAQFITRTGDTRYHPPKLHRILSTEPLVKTRVL